MSQPPAPRHSPFDAPAGGRGREGERGPSGSGGERQGDGQRHTKREREKGREEEDGEEGRKGMDEDIQRGRQTGMKETDRQTHTELSVYVMKIVEKRTLTTLEIEVWVRLSRYFSAGGH